MKLLQGKTAIITGGSDGIGLGIASAFAKAGADLILIGRSGEKLANRAGSLKDDQVQVRTIAALEDLTVSECSFDRLHAMLKGSGYWEQFALLPYAERFAERLFRREYEFLLYSATERYQAFCREKPHLVQRIPDYHLASYLGMTNVTLSRIKNSPAFNLV